MELRFQARQQRCGREALFGSWAVYAPRMLLSRLIWEEGAEQEADWLI